jgi:hypothetical protein
MPEAHIDRSTTAITDDGIVEPGSPWPLVLIGVVLALAAAIGGGLAWSRGLLGALTLDDAQRIAAVVIFIATYVVIAPFLSATLTRPSTSTRSPYCSA